MKECGHVAIEAMWSGQDPTIFEDVFAQRMEHDVLLKLSKNLNESKSVKLDEYFIHEPRKAEKYNTH